VVNPRWTAFTHTAKAQMQSQDELPIPSETPLILKMFNARLTFPGAVGDTTLDGKGGRLIVGQTHQRTCHIQHQVVILIVGI
jgi:hypothetical protein